MEDILIQLSKEASAPRFSAVRKACQDAQDLLQDEAVSSATHPHQLREKCLLPLQLVLESKNTKLIIYAINGIQRLLIDDRFLSNMESEVEDDWLPMQVLMTVASTPNLPEDSQVEVMKVLLNMTFSTNWCMNAKVITQISELCLASYLSTSNRSIKDICVNVLSRVLAAFYQRQIIYQSRSKTTKPTMQVCIDCYGNGYHGSVRTAVKATFTQMLSAISEKLRDYSEAGDAEDPCNVIAEFSGTPTENEIAADALTTDIVHIMQYLADKLDTSLGSNKNIAPLLLEGFHALLANVPTSITKNEEFIKIIWQRLCPAMISLLGNPVTDKNVVSQKSVTQEEVGRGSGCSQSVSGVTSSTGKSIYSIAVHLVLLVGDMRSLRPVLESVFHRMLLYPPAPSRHDALKAVKELLSTPESLLKLAGPTIADDREYHRSASKRKLSKQNNNLALLKLIIDSVQECCHCNESAVCCTTVTMIDTLLCSVEKISRGIGLNEDLVRDINEQFTEFDSRFRMTSISRSTTFDSDGMTSVLEELNGSLQNGNDSAIGDVQEDHGIVLEPATDREDDDVENSNSEQENDDSQPVFQKQLHTKEDLEHKFGRVEERSEHEAVERECARTFVNQLLQLLPVMLESSSTQDVDEMIQKFSSSFCSMIVDQHEGDDTKYCVILNADGVYIATYAALLLNLKLVQCGYYSSEEKSLPISEQQFIEDILGSGLLLYLSPAWLSELYIAIINEDLLHKANGTQSLSVETPLLQLLTNIDGLGSRHRGGQMLFGSTEENTKTDITRQTNQHVIDAGQRFSRYILTTCWDGILDVLSVLLNGKSSCGITSSFALMLGTEGAKEESLRAQEAICASLEGLQKAAWLACVLGLQDRCGAVFAQLANASCVIEQRSPVLERKLGKPSNKSRLVRVHTAHALSLDMVLGIGLEMGSHSGDCWKHVFRCCAHILELEHRYFSQGNNQSNLPKVQTEQQVEPLATADDNDESEPDLFLTPATPAPVVPVAPSINVHEFVKQSSVKTGWDRSMLGGGVLSSSQASQVLCGLSQEVDRLFEEAANKLNMRALVSFLTELCLNSKAQLAQYKGSGFASQSSTPLPPNVLHLYQLGDVMLRCIHSGRPLQHIMQAWSVVAPHFVEAACHNDRSISKKAVNCIHESVTTLLGLQTEQPHFHFNESLCKPYENLLCLELCDGDVQDQIVCCICELVEACTTQICSGWRPLFGALRAVKIEYTTVEEVNEARQRHIAAVLDVFDVFLNTDNVLVFANAAVDCILCLLKYVKGPEMDHAFQKAITKRKSRPGEETEWEVVKVVQLPPTPTTPTKPNKSGEFEDIDDDDSDSGSDYPSASSTEDLCLPALKYLQQCCKILSSMWNMPACPKFNGAHRIRLSATPRCVDPVLLHMDFASFSKQYEVDSNLKENSDKKIESDKDQTNTDQCDDDDELDHEEDASSEKESEENERESVPEKSDVLKDDSEVPVPEEVTLQETAEFSQNVTVEHTASKMEFPFPQISLEDLDNHTGILHVWFLVLEGLASNVSTAPKNYQPQTLEMLFELLRSAAAVPGPDFSIHCVNHLVLPMLQAWLRRGNNITGYWNVSLANFKQCCGLCTDLVVEYIIQFGSAKDCQLGVEFMLKQLLDVLIECIAQPVESISRLGCACVRHCLLSCGSTFTERMWHIATTAVQHAFDVTLYCLRQLMTLFQANSDNFYGDIGQVKVAARKDCSGIECERLRQLAQQVFLLDSQRGNTQIIDYELEEDRSYIFLLYPPAHKTSNNPEHIVTSDFKVNPDLIQGRVPFRSIVIGLLSHQVLLQTIGCLLLQGSNNVSPSEHHLLPVSSEDGSTEADSLIQDMEMPGMLKHLSTRNALSLLNCLRESYEVACQFDTRPGLKFLVQKVARADVAANLYKQAGVAITFYIHTLIEISARQDNVSVDSCRKLLTAAGKNLSPGGSSVCQPSMLDQSCAIGSLDGLQTHMTVFVNKLKLICDEICSKYIDMVLDNEDNTKTDQLSAVPLFFLTAHIEELPRLKEDRKYGEDLVKKYKNRKTSLPAALSPQSPLDTQVVTVQGIDELETVESPSDGETATSPVTSDSNKPKRLKEDRVYTVATDKTIKNLMSEYKKHKKHHAMPSFVKASRSKQPVSKKDKTPSADPTDQEIEKQQQNSIMKDSEAHRRSWTEMICTILQLYQQLPDYQFQALLPTVFSFINQLICHTSDVKLKEVLAQWMHRIGHLYNFAPT